MQSFPAQRDLADQKSKQLVLDGLRMDVHMPAVDNQILERNGLIPHPLHVVLPEICDVNHCVSSEDLHTVDGTCSWIGSSANLYKLISFMEDLPVISCSWKSSWLHSTDAASSYLRIDIFCIIFDFKKDRRGLMFGEIGWMLLYDESKNHESLFSDGVFLCVDLVLEQDGLVPSHFVDDGRSDEDDQAGESADRNKHNKEVILLRVILFHVQCQTYYDFHDAHHQIPAKH